MYDLKDKVVLITGAARGIGAAIATEILEEGARHVRILDVDASAGVLLQDKLINKYGANKVKFVECDVNNDEQLFGALNDTKQEQDYLDLVINNAGLGNESSYAAIRKQIETNYIAVINGTLKAMELMDKNKGGRGGTVVNVSSMAGLYARNPQLFTYVSTKSAVIQFTRSIGAEPFYGDTGVRVIALCFDLTNTPIIETLKCFRPEDNQQISDIVKNKEKLSTQAAAKGAIEAYKKGKPASIWVIRLGKPVFDISEERAKCDEIMFKLVT